MGPGHPERPDRLRAIEAALGSEKFKRLEHLIAPFPPREALCRAHPESYLDALEQASPREGLAALDADTAMNPKTLEAAQYGRPAITPASPRRWASAS